MHYKNLLEPSVTCKYKKILTTNKKKQNYITCNALKLTLYLIKTK